MKHFIVKYIHNWLPVGSLVSKYAIQYPAGCPSCACEYENRFHLLQFPVRQPQRNKLVIGLQRFFNQFTTEPYLKILIQRVVKGVLSTEPFTIPSRDGKYNMLVRNQTLIGWDQLLLG